MCLTVSIETERQATERSRPACEEAAAHPCSSEAAFLEFHARTSGRLRSFVYCQCSDRSVADDLVQEAYLRFLRSAAKVPVGPALAGYLFRIAANLATDYLRRRRLERRWLPTSHSDEEFHEQESEQQRAPARRMESAAQLSSLFSRLRVRDQLLVWLAYGEGVDHQEIAGRLGVKEKSVRVLLSRARRRLADFLIEKKRGTS